MKVTVELDLENPADREIARDLVAREATSAPAKRKRGKRGTQVLPVSDEDRKRISHTDRKLANEIGEKHGMVRQ